MATNNNHGGKREGSGRKPREDRETIRELTFNALEEVFGSEQEAISYLAQKAKKSFPHLKLLFQYAYGVPTAIPEAENQKIVITYKRKHR
ncbi:MAG: hypothetical protein AAF502_21095 [Bacteroidota bacterium]